MNKFTRHEGIVVPMNRANVDTDAIMPKQYLKCISKFGYGDWLFDDWRYLDQGDVLTDIATRRVNSDFELNFPQYKGASILLAQQNFGCGSSREHAVWGLRDFGIQVIISSNFPDIFYNNCFNNGLLPIDLEQVQLDMLFAATARADVITMSVDLIQQVIQLPGNEIKFDIDAGRRKKLLDGQDNIAVTLLKSEKIVSFEQSYYASQPWLLDGLGR